MGVLIHKNSLTHGYLIHFWRKGFRNGNWRKLSSLERALYMASLSLAKIRGRIVNSRLVLELQDIVGKLRETGGDRAMKMAYQRSIELYERFLAIGLFEWAPQVRSWFNNQSYVLWLGLSKPEHLA